jgi:hypothetical protein
VLLAEMLTGEPAVAPLAGEVMVTVGTAAATPPSNRLAAKSMSLRGTWDILPPLTSGFFVPVPRRYVAAAAQPIRGML